MSITLDFASKAPQAYKLTTKGNHKLINAELARMAGIISLVGAIFFGLPVVAGIAHHEILMIEMFASVAAGIGIISVVAFVFSYHLLHKKLTFKEQDELIESLIPAEP